MKNKQHVYAVILAGGGGTRLWPKSRNHNPKQFLKLTGDKSMVQVTAERLKRLIDWDRMIVVSNEMYADDIKQQLPQIPQQNVISEPEKKETALAMLVGALYAKSLDPEAVIMNAASDHVVTNEDEFERVMKLAVETAQEQDHLVTIGITPTEPNTGFGYIKAGEDLKRLNQGLSLFKVDNFTEKPNRPTALAYISTGKYFWNANMYVWSAQSLQDAFKKHAPATYKLTKNLENKSWQEFHQALPDIYQQAKKIAIDYAISEKADNLVLIPGDIGWNDVGNWKVVYELGEKNSDDNVIINDPEETKVVSVSSKRNLVHADHRLVALLNVEDMVIVDTDEILLIAPKNKCQEVKRIVNKLKENGRDEYL